MSEQAGEGQRERETESQAGSIVPEWSPTWGLNPWTLSSWPETKSRVGCLTDWATQAPPPPPVILVNDKNKSLAVNEQKWNRNTKLAEKEIKIIKNLN